MVMLLYFPCCLYRSNNRGSGPRDTPVSDAFLWYENTLNLEKERGMETLRK